MKKYYTLLALILSAVLLLSACGNGAEPEKEEGPLTLGQTFEFNDLEITLGSNIGFTQFRSNHSDNDGAYVFYIPATVKNIGTSSNGLNNWDVTVYSPDGMSITNTNNAFEIEWAFEEESIFAKGNVQPDVIKQGNIYVPYDKDGEYIIEFNTHTEENIGIKFDVKFNFDAIPQVQTEFKLGEKLEVAGLEITFIDDISWDTIRNNWSENAGKPYFYLPVSMRNISDEAKGFPWGMQIHGPNGQTVDTVEWEVEEEGIKRANDLVPGASIQENLYILYVGDGDYTFTFSDWDLLDDLTVTLSIELDPDDLPVVQTEFTLNETFEFDDFEITIIDDINWGRIVARWSDLHHRDVAVFPVTVKNIGDSTSGLGWNVKLYGPNGIELENIMFYVNDDIKHNVEIRPGATLETFVHVLYDEDGEYVIEFSDFRSDDISVFIPITKE